MCGGIKCHVKGLLLLFALLMLHSVSLNGQNLPTTDKINFNWGLYHKKIGWVNSVGFYTGNWDELVESVFSIGQHPSFQIDYLRYKLVKPKIGLGGGVALKLIPTEIHGYEDFGYYKYAELFGYGKKYLNNKRRRSYIDAKLGYAHAIGNFRFSCYGCEEQGSLYLRYSPGITTQFGFGLEFANSSALRSGMKLSFFQNLIKEQLDVYPTRWKLTPEGIMKRRTSTKSLIGLLIGFNLYI